ncbi:hypothetical protein N7447_006760 [Penicillium robsamsonii]|uniref:uncharacterized protein n=1 Tax=Penicillium robsamsonii TaxID=1792511 RepID=UPI002546C3BF|nr:uncharacterized protein N7447_006760 [Penicillium robsamsonii]KAJ5824420.1 hypothetical protein N7447_006760 [Penicillium robsamsonii]
MSPVILFSSSGRCPPLWLCQPGGWGRQGHHLSVASVHLAYLLFPFLFFEVGNLSWSAARIPPKRTSSDRSKSAPKYHDEFRFALRLVRNLI